MELKTRVVLLRLCTVLIAVCSSLVSTAAVVPQQDIDLRLLIDVSAPAHERDEAGLRGSVVEQLVQLLPDGAQASIWGYAQSTRRIAKQASVNGLWRQVAGIHARHLSPASRYSDLHGALKRVLYDLDQPQRKRTHLLLLSNGRILLKDPTQEEKNHQNTLKLVSENLALRNVVVHTLAIAPQVEGDDWELLRQIADATGGMHRVIADEAEARRYVLDLVRLLQLNNETSVDSNGRFRISPNTRSLTVLWEATEQAPSLVTPGGRTLDRFTPLENGRWVEARNFEMVSIQEPQPGWWVATADPLQVAFAGELDILVEGLESPVVP